MRTYSVIGVLPGIEPGVAGYAALHAWSVNDPGRFWQSIADYFDIEFSRRGDGRALAKRALPGAIWFPGYELNYAEHALRHARGTAVVSRDESGARREMSFDELRDAVGRCRVGLVGLGVKRGDAVVAYLGNSEEAVIAFLACASLGAIWSSCPPEFGASTVLDIEVDAPPDLGIGLSVATSGGVEIAGAQGQTFGRIARRT